MGEAKASIVVQTIDGRELSGEIDERTTAEALWIRREANQIVLTSSVSWDSIVGAAIDGEIVEVATLVEQWPGMMSRGPAGIVALAVKSPHGYREKRLAARPKGSRIVALEIDAVLVNLDRDVEPDGFELVIAALDEQGRAVPVRGNISARLVGERDEKHSGRIRFEELQRWSQPVAREDFLDGVASYALRFQTVRPEFDWELIPVALLNVRLGIPGEGNFEASIPVEIRQFNPFRDQLQKYERSRFLSDELSGEVRRQRVAWPGRGLTTWAGR
ncbi:MAG: hypothetical protein GXP24_08145 [Planctomycetes bacterium]|nr:hypothetical protein [Planctomycetota bacterium]